MSTRRAIARPVALALALLAACGGGPTKHELYMEGMKIEGEASRGECQPAFDTSLKAHVLDGDVVQGCLHKTEEAIALYEQAKAKGLEDLDFVKTHERALERKAHLESMLKVIRQIERPDGPYPGAPPGSAPPDPNAP
ncbi:MAG: hypothetical protein KC420_16395 [Myxococcales bacterium]|nr:hypothetical protein [Myxococcales bacterium]MCB9569243.1 hypothetical protein [Myxococcales bacterium]MCB9706114.1 hypothetical protein [Myxococcales bacterium]